jgi:hypothetical protein
MVLERAAKSIRDEISRSAYATQTIYFYVLRFRMSNIVLSLGNKSKSVHSVKIGSEN